jgi:hypothetical protein
MLMFSEAQVLARFRYLANVHVLPLDAKLSPNLWLGNFSDSEKPYALSLLLNFLYFSNAAVEAIFRASFQNLSQVVAHDKTSYMAVTSEWLRFLKTTLIVMVTGERPHITDSGHLFARMARDQLGIDETRIVSPLQAISWLVAEPRDVVFVDDFAGTGEQFVTTWTTVHSIAGGRASSFRDLHQAIGHRIRIFYMPIICTTRASDRIGRDCAGVRLLPGHVFTERYGAFGPGSLLWDPALNANDGQEFLRVTSARIGIPDTDGGKNDWRGFNKLGLAVAFEHGWPDATLPLFHWETQWQPLLRK